MIKKQVNGVSFMKSTLSGWVALLLYCFCGQALAISLEEFVYDTIQAHPKVKQKIHLYREKVADLKIAQGFWKPTVDLTASGGAYSGKSPIFTGDYNSWNADLTIVQNLYDGHETVNQIKQSKAQVEEARYQLIDTVDNIALVAIKAYLNALKQKELVLLAEENMDTHMEMMRSIKERFDSGLGKRSEVEQVEARVASARASLLAEQNNFEDALTELHNVLGRYVYADDLEEVKVPPFPGSMVDELIDEALAKNPALQVARYNIEATQANYDRSLKNYRPRVDLQFKKTVGDRIGGYIGTTDQTSLTLEMRYNLYNGGKDEWGQQFKISKIYEQQAYAAQSKREAINALRLGWMADRSLAKQTVYLDNNMLKNQQVLESYKEEFDLGQRTLTDILDVKNDLNDAQKKLVTAKYDAYIARYRVFEAVGTLFEPLHIDLDIKDGNFQIAMHNVNQLDHLPLNADIDKDKEIDRTDHCDNTLPASKVDQYGCVTYLQPNFDYQEKRPAPEGEDDFITVEANQITSISKLALLSNDSTTGKAEQKTLLDFTQPEHGKLAKSIDNQSLIYRPDENYLGDDSFEYTLTDEFGGIGKATVFVTVVKEKLRGKLVVNFVYNKTRLTKTSQQRFDRLVKKINWNEYQKIIINAYTDFIGNFSYNEKLSKRRAEAIKALLVKKGAKPDMIEAYGWGESNPVAKNTSDAGRAINRRGEILFVIKPEFGIQGETKEQKDTTKQNWKAIKFIEFVADSNNMATGVLLKINRYVQNLRAGNFKKIIIEVHGYYDDKTPESLARKRANKVKEALSNEGLDKKQISIYSWNKKNRQSIDKGSIPEGIKENLENYVEVRFYYE